jgi:hypothetical protein
MAQNALMADPYAQFRRLPASTFKYQAPSADVAAYDEVSGNMRMETPFHGWSADDAFLNQLNSSAFQSKYNILENLGDNRLGVTFQQPGAHKYDTMRAEYGLDPATNEWVLQNNPMDAPTRQMSSAEGYRDNAELAGKMALMAAALYGGGYGLSAGIGAAGAGAGAGAATATGMTAAEQIAFLAANGMTDAAIVSAYPSLAAAGGLTGVGGAAVAGGLSGMDLAADGGPNSLLQSGGGDTTRAALYGSEGYGAGMTGGETSAFDAGMKTVGNGMSNTGTSLADFFSGNGSASDYLRLAQGIGGLYANNRAAGAAQDGEANRLALLERMYADTRKDNQPLLDLRNSTLPQINALMANPNSITSDPGYQFGLKQGQSQIDNQAAARGGYYSGAQLKASQRYGQDYAGTKLNDSLNRLMGVAGLGQVGATGNANNNSQFGQQAGNSMVNTGNIRGSGYMGGFNTANNGLNSWMQDSYWDKLLQGGGG